VLDVAAPDPGPGGETFADPSADTVEDDVEPPDRVVDTLDPVGSGVVEGVGGTQIAGMGELARRSRVVRRTGMVRGHRRAADTGNREELCDRVG